jgi:hypothetical protein
LLLLSTATKVTKSAAAAEKNAKNQFEFVLKKITRTAGIGAKRNVKVLESFRHLFGR